MSISLTLRLLQLRSFLTFFLILISFVLILTTLVGVRLNYEDGVLCF